MFFFFSRLLGLSQPHVTRDQSKSYARTRLNSPLFLPHHPRPHIHEPAVLVAEVVAHFYPRLVELHNYSSANSLSQKMYNWNTLNARVLKRLGFTIPKQDCEDISNTKPGAIERVLKLVKFKMAKFQEKHGVVGPGGAGNGVSSEASNSRPVSSQQQQQQQPQQQQRPALAPHPQQQQPPQNPLSAAAVPKKSALKVPGHVAATAPVAIGQQEQEQQQPAGTAAMTALRHPQAAAAAATDHPGVVAQKDAIIAELKETNDILETKTRKLEQLVRLKDAKIQTLLNKLQAMGAP